VRLLYVYQRRSRFTDIDRDILAREYDLVELPGRPPGALLAALRADVVVIWFAGWHALLPALGARLRRRPLVVITGGYDVADVPEAGYGMQQGGVRKLVSSWVLRRATRLMANSESGRREALRAAPAATVDVVLHGVPDLAPDADLAAPREGALTVGAIDRPNLLRKGLRAFVAAAAALPEVPFTLAGRVDDPAALAELAAAAGPNVRIVEGVDDAVLGELYAASAVYVQASLHEGFGMAVAEAMCAGCIPVVTPAGALPEVVGSAGVVTSDVAGGVREALGRPASARAAARARVLERFTLAQRADGLLATVRAATQDRA
jgi:glycosyltransferase involved in cell wall biosynthesis